MKLETGKPVKMLSFSLIAWTDKVHNFDKKKIYRNFLGNFSVVIATATKRKKCFFKNMNLVDTNYHGKNWVDWISTRLHFATSKICMMRKRTGNLKKHNIFIIHDYRPQSCSEKVVSPYWELQISMINRKT